MTGPRNLYDILNVSQGAEPVVIEAAYRALMKKYHPDQGAAAAADAPSAAEINQAFAVLRDPERRAQYDHHEWTRQQNMHLAHYPPPPPPRAPRAFGWGGWIVALLLAAVILLMARGQTELAAVDPPAADFATAAKAETRATGQMRALPSFLSGNAPEREVDLMRRAANVSARATLAEAEAREALSGRPEAAQPSRPKPRPYRRHPRARRQAEHKDFLEREGYIY